MLVDAKIKEKEFLKCKNAQCCICGKQIEADDLEECEFIYTRRKERKFLHKKCIKLMR